METEGRAAHSQSTCMIGELAIARAADMRYVGQEHAVTVDIPLERVPQADRAAIKRHFDEVHEQRYGYAARRRKRRNRQPAQLGDGRLRKPAFERMPVGRCGTPATRCERQPAGLFRRHRRIRRRRRPTSANMLKAGNVIRARR